MTICVLVGVLLVPACAEGPDAPSEDPDLLYRTLLAATQDEWANSGPIFIDPRTYDFGGRDSLLALPLPEALTTIGTAARALVAANQGSVLLNESIVSDGPAVLLSEEVAKQLDLGGFMWQRLRRQHGDGMVVVRFSRPGIDPQTGQALMTYSWASFIGYGEGYHVVLDWREGLWEVERRVSAWSW